MLPPASDGIAGDSLEITMNPTPQNPSPGRLGAIITGGAIASIATLVLAAGAALHWVEDRKDADGFYSTSAERFSTNTYALTTENLDIDDGLPGSATDYGNLRLKVRSDDAAPVFVGIGRTADVERYLDRSAHATLTDFDVDPFAAEYRTTDGLSQPAAPATQPIWVAQASGGGTQTLDWDAEDGNWSVVVMNADGSAGVDTDISVGADVPIIGDLADGFTIGGGAGLAAGLALMAGGLIRPRRRPSVLAGSASAA
ncbi:MAG TPA: hypothetical protein VFZ00_25805 [Solirubrobacter sp.]|nr:hypothetical protein [Solirubrobacter sp.]